jgi:hypothetical protein
MATKKSRAAENLTADPITEKLGSPAGIPAGCASLKGYLGPAQGTVHRIYLDNSFWKWLEVEAEHIVYRRETPPNERDSRDEFWIARGAQVINCQASIVQEIERELAGSPDDDAGSYGKPPW